MKKFISFVVSLAIISTSFVSALGAEATQTMQETKMPLLISGTIEKETENAILVKPYGEKEAVMLRITDNTYIINAVTGAPLTLKDRIADNIVAYYGPEETKSIPAQSNAVAILCSIPQDYGVPSYNKVEAIEKSDKEVKVTINNGSIIATIKDDVPISPFKTKNTVAIGNIDVGTELLLWTNTTTMSYPGKTTATKVVILGANEANEMKDDKKPMDEKETNKAFTVDKKMISTEDKKAKGELPEFVGILDKTFADKLAKWVDNVYEVGVKSAKEDDSVTFSFDTYQFKNYTSIVMHTSVMSANTSTDKIDTIVLDHSSNKQYSVMDILGSNAYKLINQFIVKTMDNATEGSYFTDENAFKGVKSEPKFYIDEKGNVVIIFDKYAIASGAMGTPKFTIPQNSILHYELSKKDLHMEEQATMIPLRQVVTAFGYQLKWDGNTQAIDIIKGNESHKLLINENNYDDKKLEYKPILIDGITYVPLSYFEIILGGCYTVDESKITFSKFTQPISK